MVQPRSCACVWTIHSRHRCLMGSKTIACDVDASHCRVSVNADTDVMERWATSKRDKSSTANKDVTWARCECIGSEHCATTHGTPWVLVALHECCPALYDCCPPACRVTLNSLVHRILARTVTTLSQSCSPTPWPPVRDATGRKCVGEQSSTAVNCSPEEFIPVDKRKWNDIPAVDNVKRESLVWKITKKLTTFVRHRQRNREVDGAVYWCSLLSTLRRDFEREGGSNLLRLSMAALYARRKRPTQILVLRGLERQSLVCSCHPIAPESCRKDGKNSCTMWKALVLWHSIQGGFIAGGKDTKEKAAIGVPHTFGPFWWRSRKGFRWFIKAKKSTLQEQVEDFSGRGLLGSYATTSS